MSNPVPPPIPPHQEPQKNLTGRQSYNVVTDTVGGLNVRWKDNVFQAIAALVFGIVAFIVVMFTSGNDFAISIMAGVGGGIVGVFASGMFLMIYRAVQHARGKHD
jgi:uncharacterized membrane protein YedE/YeeE